MMIKPIVFTLDISASFWPISRESHPPEFSPIFGEQSPYQEVLAHLSDDDFDAPTIIASEDFRFLATSQAEERGIWDANIVSQPHSRSGSAVLLDAVLQATNDPEAIILLAPILHIKCSQQAFKAAVSAAINRLQKGEIIGLSSQASQSHFEIARAAGTSGADRPFLRTVSTSAQTDIAESNHWTSFTLARQKDLIAAFEEHAPELLTLCKQTANGAAMLETKIENDEGDDASRPTAIADILRPTTTTALDGDIISLSDWASIWNAMERDNNGVAKLGDITAVGCRESLLHCDDDAMQMVGVGLDNVVAVATKDAILVADRDRLEDVPQAVAQLRARNKPQATDHPRCHRPWGWYESLIMADRFQVKRIMVKPGGVLSLQSHVHRSEHWIVVSGTAEVTVGDEVKLVPENGSVYIPLGTVHRMANPGKVPMYLIEVQTGTYLGEDDIKRYEDIYDRC